MKVGVVLSKLLRKLIDRAPSVPHLSKDKKTNKNNNNNNNNKTTNKQTPPQQKHIANF